jgi:hypothetical protein
VLCERHSYAALQEARGGEVVVREGLLVQPPTITAQPADATVNEGATVQLKVAAVVRTRGTACVVSWQDERRLSFCR